MRPRPFALYSLTIVGSLIGVLLSLEGLHARLYGGYWLRRGTDPLWHGILRALSGGRPLDLHQAGWLLVVVGTMWFGALTGLWLKHRWGRHAVLTLAVLSALHGGAFLISSAVCLGLALSASIQRSRGGSPNA